MTISIATETIADLNRAIIGLLILHEKNPVLSADLDEAITIALTSLQRVVLIITSELMAKAKDAKTTDM